jgi:Domain of unknown function (DUF4157)
LTVRTTQPRTRADDAAPVTAPVAARRRLALGRDLAHVSAHRGGTSSDLADAVAMRDVHEHEAERVAAAVAQPGSEPLPTPPSAGAFAATAERDAVRRDLGAGSALDAAIRRFFEPRFGRDLGGVRVHAGSAAARAADALDAVAYTLGSDIVFAADRYEPGTPAGKALLAHELTHAVQQGEGIAPPRVQRQAAATRAPQTFPRTARTVGHENELLPPEEYSKRLSAGTASPYPGLKLMWDLDKQFFVIVAAFELRGVEATAENAATIQRSIRSHWNASFGGWTIGTVVTVDVGAPGTKAAADKGIIELFRAPVNQRSGIEKFGPGRPQNRKVRLNINGWVPTWTPAHEFGHYIGLDDMYTNVTDPSGAIRSVAKPGWEGTIMAETHGVVSLREIMLLVGWWANWPAKA